MSAIDPVTSQTAGRRDGQATERPRDRPRQSALTTLVGITPAVVLVRTPFSMDVVRLDAGDLRVVSVSHCLHLLPDPIHSDDFSQL